MELHYMGEITLEPEYAVIMDFCEYCIEICEEIFNFANINYLTKLDIDTKKYPEVPKLKDDALHDYLYSNGLLYEGYKKKLFLRLLLDFCIYMRKSIENMKDFNPQVALTLCRKPLIDNLFYFEKLKYDAKETIDNIMMDDNPIEVKYNTVKDINEKIKTKFPDKFIDVLDIRYGKTYPSLKLLCDKASHIVTLNKEIKSEQGELNFIFMENQTINDFTKNYLMHVPIILYYAIQIIVDLFNEIYNFDTSLKEINEKILSMNLFNVLICVNKLSNKEMPEANIKDIKLFCPKCKKENNFISSINKKRKRYVQCLCCGKKQYFHGYITKELLNGKIRWND